MSERQPAQSLGELQHELSVYTRERDSLLASIREARAEARKETIQASACRQPVPQAVIDRWQAQIKDAATELIRVEQKIGEVNRQLRALRASGAPFKSLAKLPNGAEVKTDLKIQSPAHISGQTNNSPKEGRVLFLEFFHQLVSENIDPRLVEVLERDAHSLVNDYRATHLKGENHE
jgi:hypothetical protein